MPAGPNSTPFELKMVFNNGGEQRRPRLDFLGVHRLCLSCFPHSSARHTPIATPTTIRPIDGQNVKNVRIPGPTGFEFGDIAIQISSGPVPTTSSARPAQSSRELTSARIRLRFTDRSSRTGLG
ncbi:MAG: hypothetical protein H7Y88_00410 [Phycisphaerales bacterium]|nr:hypothetical protein [Phycisphaerales bacterium]